jgi:hypothetical protein
MNKIKIVSNVLNDDLYAHSKSFYESMKYDKITVSGKDRNYFAFNFINHIITNKEKYNFDWMVYIDEDCFITNQQALEDLIQYQINNNYACSGVPDGGVISLRVHNPIAINMFFMILNIGEIRKKYDINAVKTSLYGEDLNKHIPTLLMKKEYIYKPEYKEITNLGLKPFDIKFDNFESYYCFFFWLLRNDFKMLYLDANEHTDNITTIVKNQNGVEFAYHTWYGRKWNRENTTKNRILNVINYCNKIKTNE